MNTIAFLIPVVLFLFWGLIGYATLTILHSQRTLLQNSLLAPAIGIAVTLFPIFILSRAGFPVSKFGSILTITLFMISIFILSVKRPYFPYKKYLPFFLVFILALCLTGSPLLAYGFNWISYANDDMTNYCLRALRFLNHGFLDSPSVNTLVKGNDYSEYMWFIDVSCSERAGVDLLLAWVSAVVGLKPIKLFMPFILSLYLVLISSSSALLLSKQYKKNNFWLALSLCTLLAFSPLLSFSVFYQFLGQVGGVALLLTACIILFSCDKRFKFSILKNSILISLIVSVLLITYPEVMPLLCLSALIYIVIVFFQDKQLFYKFLIIGLCSFLISLFLLNKYWFDICYFLYYQSTRTFIEKNNSVFPYFLNWSGFSSLWGFKTIVEIFTGATEIITNALAILMVILSIFVSVVLLRKRYTIIFLFLSMLMLSALMIFYKNGFGLFKLSMYIQPLLLGVFVITLFYFFKRNISILLVICLSIISWHTQSAYIKFSHGFVGEPFVELSNASATGIVNEIEKTIKEISCTKNIIADTSHVVAAKLLANILINRNTKFTAYSFFLPHNYNKLPTNRFTAGYKSKVFDKTKFLLINSIKETLYPQYFNLHDLSSPQLTNMFEQNISFPDENSILIAAGPLRTIFNRNKNNQLNEKNFISLDWDSISNHLMFITSSLGQYYYSNFNSQVSVWNLENDSFYPNRSFSRIGRYLLFQVIKPTDHARMVVDMTTTLNRNGYNQLPKLNVIGNERIAFPSLSRGSARVFSSLISTQLLNNRSYLMLDLGKAQPEMVMENDKSVYGYARNISLISEAEYQRLIPPSFLNEFPKDLANLNLEYSGIYEDGWLSEDSFFVLSQSKNIESLIIKGMFPEVDSLKSNELTIFINDHKVKTLHIIPGNFYVAVNVPFANQPKKKISLKFNKIFNLALPDNRPSSAKLIFIGFKEKIHPPSQMSFPLTSPETYSNFYDAYSDGWVKNKATFHLNQSSLNKKFYIKGMIPKIDPNFASSQFKIFIDGKELFNNTLKPGAFNFAISFSNKKTTHLIKLELTGSQILAKNDPRSISARIESIGFED